jgi:hypothetical protein
MLLVTVELIPHGRYDKREVLDTIVIANDGTGDETTGNYSARLVAGNHPRTQTPDVSVRGFERSRGALALLREVLKELGA